MKRLLLVAVVFCGGCVAVPPDIQALRVADALQAAESPPLRETVIAERKWLFGKHGLGLFEPDARVAFLQLLLARRQTGKWPRDAIVSVRGGKWRVQQVGDCLLCIAEDGTPGVIREAMLAPDAYVGLDAAHADMLRLSESVIGDGSRRPTTIVPIMPR